MPPEISLVTVNARQQAKDLDEGRLQTLAASVRSRRTDGGDENPAPDVIVVNEMNPKQLARLVEQLDGMYDGSARYAPAESSGKGRAKAVVNTKTVGVTNVEQWNDVCEPKALFQIAELRHLAGDEPFVVASIHFSPRYPKGGDCRRQNIEELRKRLGTREGPAFIAGDFNKRCVEIERECDPEEASKPAGWWRAITKDSSLDGRGYEDAVKSSRQARGLPLKDQWTHEQTRESVLCDGSTGLKRSRIDFVFASNDAKILEAGVDTSSAVQTYSDHRLVSCRFELGA